MDKDRNRENNRPEIHAQRNDVPRKNRFLSWGFALLVLVLTLVSYGWIQTRLFTPGIAEPDSAAYVWMAEKIGFGLPLSTLDDDVFRHQTHVWVRNNAGRVLPKYAPGYPALMGLAWRLFGQKAAFAVAPVAGGLALIAAFFLFYGWMSPGSAALAVLVLAMSPMYAGYSGYVLTHGVDIALITTAMALLWRWMRSPGVKTGALCGLLLGMTPLVRHSNAVLALTALAAIPIACATRLRRGKGLPWLPVIAFVSAGLIFPMLLIRYNLELFGSPWISGYALSNEQTAFDAQRMLANLVRLPGAINHEGLPLIFGMGLAGLFLVGPPGERLVRWLWVLPIMLLYAAYYWTPMNASYVRFLFGVFPVFVGAAFAWVDEYARLKGGIKRGLAPLIGALVLGLPNLAESLSEAQRLLATENATLTSAAAAPVSRHVLNGSVVLAEPPLGWYVPGVHNPELYDLYAVSGQAGRQIRYNQRHRRFEPRWQEKRQEWILDFYENHGEEAPQIFQKKLTAMLKGGTPAVMIAPTHNIERWMRLLGSSFEPTPLETWQVPEGKTLPWSSPRRRRGTGQEWSLVALSLK